MEFKASLKTNDVYYNDPEKQYEKDTTFTLNAENSLQMMISVHMNDLPDEIIEFILTYLPPYGDLESCSLVCRRWNQIVKSKFKLRIKPSFQ